MLKKTLTGFLFLGLLSSVRSDGSYPPKDFDYGTFLVGSYKDKCSDLQDQSACLYWDTLSDEISESQSVSRQRDDFSWGNGTALGKQPPEENTEEFLSDAPSADFRNKRFNVFRRRNPNAQGYKRGPGFRSWGGKRNFQYLEHPLDKKTKFTSWGGKRNDFFNEFNDKRSKFISWGGKRDFDFSADKRTGFKSWGGKRNIPHSRVVKKDAEIPGPYEVDKRTPLWKDVLYMDEPYKKHFPKRPQFQSWGGKRGIYPLSSLLAFFYARPGSIPNGEKRKFSSWGGKRSYENQYDTVWGEMKNDLKRQNFQSWGGKRDSYGGSQETNQMGNRESEKTNSINEGLGGWGGKWGGGR